MERQLQESITVANYIKIKRTKFFAAILVLLLCVVTMIMLPGCGDDETYKISGKITAGGIALSGVTVTLSGDATMDTTTDINGNYGFGDLPTGKFVVTPSLTGYIFSPTSRQVWLDGIDAKEFDFTGLGLGRVAAATHTVYLKTVGTVWAWGNNSNGQLGDGTTTQSSSPLQVSGLSGVSAIAAGTSDTVALKTDGTVWAWGSNSNGQLGNGTTTQKTTPGEVIELTGVTAIAAGASHTVALKTVGSVWAWGSNSNGQLGDGKTSQKTTPVEVTGLSGITAIAAGTSHTVALKNDGKVWAWGNNSNGQLGDGTTTQSASPVQVQFL